MRVLTCQIVSNFLLLQNNKTLVTLLDNLGNSFDSLRVPRNASCSIRTEEQSIPTDESPPQKSEGLLHEFQPESLPVSSETSLSKTDAKHGDEITENKVYPVSSNLKILIFCWLFLILQLIMNKSS